MTEPELHFVQGGITSLMLVALPTLNQMKMGHCRMIMSGLSSHLTVAQRLKNHNGPENGIK